MKSSVGIYALATLASTALSTPIDKRTHEIDYTSGVDFTKIDYPAGTGENLPSYPNCNPVFQFTSTFHIRAVPGEVVNGTTNPTPTGGLEGAEATYDFGINSDLEFICYNIVLTGFRGEYQSPAKTATHVHEAARGRNGPPRLAFPNPQGDGHERYSRGCLTGMSFSRGS